MFLVLILSLITDQYSSVPVRNTVLAKQNFAITIPNTLSFVMPPIAEFQTFQAFCFNTALVQYRLEVPISLDANLRHLYWTVSQFSSFWLVIRVFCSRTGLPETFKLVRSTHHKAFLSKNLKTFATFYFYFKQVGGLNCHKKKVRILKFSIFT
jgi:hypothetical protein